MVQLGFKTLFEVFAPMVMDMGMALPREML